MTQRRSPAAPWGKPINLGPIVNSKWKELNPCLSADRLNLFFASFHSRDQGKGDLWVSTRLSPTEPWGKPVNLQGVNSRDDEYGPNLSANGETLYFHSDRSGGQGNSLLERLADYCLKKQQTIPALRSISTGGGPVSPTLPERLSAIAPNAIIKSVYGSTEAEPIASVINDEISVADKREMRVGAGLLVGRPVEGCNVKIFPSRNGNSPGPFSESEFESLTLRQGEIGEIVVSGRHVLPGYADPERNRETKIEVGPIRWHRTGDAGYFDTHGRLWLVGRCAAAIRDTRGIVIQPPGVLTPGALQTTCFLPASLSS